MSLGNQANTGCFVTGTDTGSGKTVIACALLKAFAAQSLRCAGFKPVAAGCEQTADGFRNADALALIASSNVDLDYEIVNPFGFADAIAPHIAAQITGTPIELDDIEMCFREILARADVVIVEGAGGLRVPLQSPPPLVTMADLARRLGLPVLLVVGMRLGCLNHALLSVEALSASGLRLCGWVANHVDGDMERAGENLEYLQRALPAPLIGVVPRLDTPSPDQVAEFLEVSRFLHATADV